MSRIGRAPIAILSGVTVKVEDGNNQICQMHPVIFFLPGLGGPTESRRKKVPEIQQLIQGVFKGAGEIVEHAHKLFVFPLGDAAAQRMTAAWGGGFCAGSQGYGDGAAADIHSASVIALCFQCIQKCFCHFLGEKRDRTFQRQFLRTGKL